MTLFQLGVERAGLGRGSAPGGQRLDAKDPHTSAYREAEHVTDADRHMAAIDRPAGEAQPAALGELLGERARLHDPREPEEFVEPEAVSHVSP